MNELDVQEWRRQRLAALADAIGGKADLGRKPACPDDQELRNLETAASSTTAKPEVRKQRAIEAQAARACRAKGTAYADELRAALAAEEQSASRRREIADTVRRCTVGDAGQLICPRH